jgi:FdrA protein
VTGAVVNRVRRGFYLDSVALMRLSRQVADMPGIATASLMIGTPSNLEILAGAGLLAGVALDAGPNDLILAVCSTDAGKAGSDQAEAAMAKAELLLESGRESSGGGRAAWQPRSLLTGIDALPNTNLVLISVPGAFAAAEARRALNKGLNVMMFSDNVPLAAEVALKQLAVKKGLLMMGPDCGTALIGGVPLAFANVVPRGPIGLVAASGTGLQEVSSLIARLGGGISHGIGVGGRDLGDAVGGAMTLVAIDALDRDLETKHIVLISKPPAAAVAAKVLARVGESSKPFTICFMGAPLLTLPANARQATTLAEAAHVALGMLPPVLFQTEAAEMAAAALGSGRRHIRGLYAGGTLCAEAQVVLMALGETVCSNAAIPGAAREDGKGSHLLLDLGDDEYTRGRPHPMIDPTVRASAISEALGDPSLAVMLVDVVIGCGAHEDPAAVLAAQVATVTNRPAVVASICGTDDDPQGYDRQIRTLEAAGILVSGSNQQAVELALMIEHRARKGF